MRPSPFPGMDPYLEDPSIWRGIHTRLLAAISDDLAARLAPSYFVAVEERVYIATSDDLVTYPPVVPDVFLVTGRGRSTLPSAGPITTPTLIEPLVEEEIHDRYLEIRDTRSRAVVTTIEVLSPTNKASGTRGREAFMRKRQAVMESQTHWIEIDLLRWGDRPAEVRGRSAYYALLRRGEGRAPYAAWLTGLRESLPTIAVPLRPPFPDQPLNLQELLSTVYRRGYYADTIDYDAPVPAPPLSADDARWAADHIAAWRASQTPPAQ